MSELINKNLVILDIEVTSKEDIISKLANFIEKENRLCDIEGYIKQVYLRESDFSTAIGFDVCIPHGKCSAVTIPTVAFARLKKAIQWSEDEQAKYVFLLAIPDKDAGDLHLQILAKLARKIMNEKFRENLGTANTVDELLTVLDI